MRISRRLLLIFSLLLLALPAAAVAGALVPAQPTAADLAGITAKEAAFDPHPGKQYGETWTLMARTDRGAMVFAQVIISSTGLENFFPGYSLTIISPDGTALTEAQEYEPEMLEASRDKLNVRFGPVRLAGAHPTYRLRIDGARLDCDLVLNVRAPGYSAGNGVTKIGSDKFSRVCWIATDARVEGTLTIDGRPLDASGWGSLDHLVSNVLGPTYSVSWTIFQVHSSDMDVILQGFDANSDYNDRQLYLLLICEDGRNLAATTQVQLIRSDFVVEPYSGRLMPKRIVVRAQDRDLELSFTVSGDYVVHRMQVLERVSPITAAIVRTFVADPVYIRAFSKVNLNVDLNGSSRSVPAEALGQLIYIK